MESIPNDKLKQKLPNKDEFPIYSFLNELYATKENSDHLQSMFEDYHSKFSLYFSKESPTLIVRIPYSVILFGDSITKLFPDKVITNTTQDLILLLNKNDSKELNIKFFDNLLEIKTHINEFDNSDEEINSICEKSSFQYYLLKGFYSALKYANPKDINGFSCLVILNSNNLDSNIDLNFTSFLAMNLACLYLHYSIPDTKKDYYDFVYSEISKIVNDEHTLEYYASLLYFKIFLRKHCFGFQIKNNFFIHDTSALKNYKALIFDSFSPKPIRAYSSKQYWNKRIVEIRLAMALILKRYKQNISNEEIISISSSPVKFLEYFGNNLEVVSQLLETYLKKNFYTKAEISEELKFELKKLCSGISFPEGVLMSKDFFLFDRLNFILREYQCILTIYQLTKNDQKLNLIKLLEESGLRQKKDYSCYSDEMIRIENYIKEKFENVGVKHIGEGWSGKMILITKSENGEEYLKEMQNLLTKINDKSGDGLVSAWISDDISSYCYLSDFEGNFGLMDPKYEDFMLDYVKLKNNVTKPQIQSEEEKTEEK